MELAEALAARPTDTEYRRRVSEWSPELEALAVAVDRIGEVAAILVKVNGGRAPVLRPFTRPSTALDRIRERMRFERHRALVRRLTDRGED